MPKYTFTSDEGSSDNEDDISMLFNDLDRTNIAKINELLDSLNENNRFWKHKISFMRNLINLLV
jgi:hypothetical protein